MISIFNELYTLVVNDLASFDNEIKTSSVYTNTPSSFPFVSMEEIENSVYSSTSDDCTVENHAYVNYEFNVYTKNPDKKSKGDAISNHIDNLMSSLNLTRVSRNILQDTNETIYRIVLRYEGVVSKDKTIYRR